MHTSVARRIDALHALPNEATVTVGWVKTLIEELPGTARDHVASGSKLDVGPASFSECYTAKQVAKELGIRVRRVYDLANRNEIPVKRVGRRQMRFPRAALSEWLNSGNSPFLRPT